MARDAGTAALVAATMRIDAFDRQAGERLNGEIKRRTYVVAIFPNEGAIVSLVGALLL